MNNRKFKKGDWILYKVTYNWIGLILEVSYGTYKIRWYFSTSKLFKKNDYHIQAYSYGTFEQNYPTYKLGYKLLDILYNIDYKGV